MVSTRLLLLVRRGWLLHPKYVRAYPLQHLPKLCAAPLYFAPVFPCTFATYRAPPSDSAVEWQMCAIKGRLPGQGDLRLRFAQPPSELSINPNHGLFGQCSGYTGGRCDMPWIGFAAWSKCPRSQRPLRSPTAAEARALARGCCLGPGREPSPLGCVTEATAAL